MAHIPLSYKQGAQAFADRCTAKANPYGFETMGWLDWKAGFDDAKRAAEASGNTIAAQAEAVRNANAHLSNAGLPTYSELLDMLGEAKRLGLNFDIGSAYIRRAYIDHQDALKARIRTAELAAIPAVLAA